MLAKVIIENGQKKIQALTADTGAGNPVGTVIAVYSNQVPNGYLPCNGVAFDTAQFPVLYALLGDDHTPDLRECTLVGVGRSGRTMGAHDEYTLGQFKDDQSQKITGRYNATGSFGSNEGAFAQTSAFEYANGVTRSGTQWSSVNFDSSGSVRTGTTTHGKQVGVNWCIKATSGLTENQQENVLNTINENNSYSTEEHPTGAKWIDGKMIYSLVIPINNQVSVLNNYDLTDKNIEWVTKSDVMTYNDNKQHIETNLIDYNISTKKLVATSSLWCSYANLEYTKTTD